jgi:hypothetical protein
VQGFSLQEIPTMRRHHLGRAVLVGGMVQVMTAAAAVEQWAEAEAVLAAIVGSFRATDGAA